MKTLALTISAVSLLWVGCSETSPNGPTIPDDAGPSSEQGVSSSSVVVDPAPGVSSSVEVSSSTEEPQSEELLWLEGDGAGVSTGGYWFGYDDLNDGGSSSWACDGVVGKEGDEFEFCTKTGPIVVDFDIREDAQSASGDIFGFAGV